MRAWRRTLRSVTACALGLSLALGTTPVWAEEVAATAEQDAAAVEQEDARDVPSLPGGIILSDEGEAPAQGEFMSFASPEGIVAQAAGNQLLAGHPEWTALGLFQHILDSTEEGTPEHSDAEIAIAILKGTDSEHKVDVASTIDFADSNDAVILLSMDAALVGIEEYNACRAYENSVEGTSLDTNVGTNCRMLAISIAQCDWSRNRIEHSSAFSVAENLAWGYIDPFAGWYDSEKETYKQTQTWSSDTGHYLNIVDPKTEVVGYAICASNASHGVCFEQSFDWLYADEPVYTVDEFREYLFTPYFTQQWTSGLGETTVDAKYGTNFYADSERNLTRYWGQNALDTMQAVVRADRAIQQYGGTAIVATSDDYYDALAASGLAGTLQSPVIITPKKEVCNQAKAELELMQPRRILVMGGEAAIEPQVFDTLKGFCSDTERVYGQNAVETAVEIYKKGNGWSDSCIIATSTGYWDALSIAPYAYKANAPIFLTNSNKRLDEGTINTIRDAGFSHAIIVGGDQVVDPAVEAELASGGVEKVDRLAGNNAIETSSEIARWEMKNADMNAEHVAVATINGYWDALTAAAVCGTQRSVLVLAGGKDFSALADVYAAAGSGGFAHVHVIGGEQALPQSVWQWLIDNAPAK